VAKDAAAVDEWMRDGARRQRRTKTVAFWARIAVAIVLVAAGASVLLNRVPAGDERVNAALRNAGLHDVTLGGADTLACAEAESSRHFTAKNADGARVEGTVCCGLTGVGKGCTVRWDR
jgi:hypothetical protein